MAANNKIVVRNEEFVADEDGEVDSASSGVEPGDLIEPQASGDYDAHATAGQANPVARFARKAGDYGKEITDSYAAGDHIKVARCASGAYINARLAAGENVAVGEAVSSAGDGTLRSAEDGTSPDGRGAGVGVTTEAVDNSSGTSAVRVVIEVL